MRISVDVTGDERAAGRFDRLATRTLDISGVADPVRAALQAGELRRFASRAGGRWPRNKPSTIRRKGHARVLIGGRGDKHPGALYRWLTQDHRATRTTATEIRFGIPRGRSPVYHAQFQSKRRNPVGVDREARTQVKSAVRDYLLGP